MGEKQISFQGHLDMVIEPPKRIHKICPLKRSIAIQRHKTESWLGFRLMWKVRVLYICVCISVGGMRARKRYKERTYYS